MLQSRSTVAKVGFVVIAVGVILGVLGNALQIFFSNSTGASITTPAYILVIVGAVILVVGLLLQRS